MALSFTTKSLVKGLSNFPTVIIYVNIISFVLLFFRIGDYFNFTILLLLLYCN